MESLHGRRSRKCIYWSSNIVPISQGILNAWCCISLDALSCSRNVLALFAFLVFDNDGSIVVVIKLQRTTSRDETVKDNFGHCIFTHSLYCSAQWPSSVRR